MNNSKKHHGLVAILSLIFIFNSSLMVLQAMEFHEAEDIGHSRDYHLLHSEDAWDTMFHAWRKQHRNQGDETRARRDTTSAGGPSIEEIERYIETFKPAFKSSQESLLILINRTAVLTGRLKSATSIQEKLVRKNYTLDKLTDVIGLRITSQTVDEALKIKGKIEKATEQFNVTETECYGMCPGSAKYRSSGYRRIHLIINIKEKVGNGKMAELQIGTPYTNMWSDWDHDFIYKGPADIKSSKIVSNYSLEMAEYFWQLDEIRRKLPACPQLLMKADSLEILRKGVAGDHAEDTYKKLGYPPNACFWWNDMKLALPEKECPSSSSSPIKAVSPASPPFIVLVTLMSYLRMLGLKIY